MQQKLAGWKTKFLNIAGRAILAKACLNNIPTHIMQYIHLPKEITKKIDQIQRNFIWGTTSAKRKLHLIKWDTLTKGKNNGGLGMQQSEPKNKALLTKLAWRAFTNPTSLWASLLINK
ncbi:hypothetical protein R3W88_033345 [Solanum pinnatisectum]|uniref:Uncharacterized protein n=1 Tax=Solanum pinnatisectum TaxID=50273 RepID=A0AAV9K196_9SOLN|nr:hypothetical protein R3W88_033345 [Solanum pinnatisectum]